MRCWLCCAAAVLFLLSCAKSETPSPDVTQANALAVEAPSAASRPEPVVTQDPFADDYASIRAQIARWDGDVERLREPRERLMGILAKDRTYAPAYVALSRVEYSSGFQKDGTYEPAALDRAEKFVNHALKLDASNFDAHCTAATIARLRGDYDIAEESLRRAEELKPDDAAAKVLRASLAAEQNEMLAAVRLAKEVIAGTQDGDLRAEAYEILIQAYVEGSHLEEADAAFREVLKLRPDSAWVHSTYAWLLLNRDDIDGAVRESEAAAAIRKYPFGTAVLARSYLAKGQQLWDANRIGESAAFVAKVANLSDDDAEVSFALGKFYEGAAVRSRDASMRQKALEAYRRVLKINPRHMEAERAVARLERRTG
ncbi:MAG TPA: tetratricopeptide repeat protein [Thermoanaerobaculia bacterium]|nr:tetratricopeptide repeat protein [Thermoanaerobaculia bacterium]